MRIEISRTIYLNNVIYLLLFVFMTRPLIIQYNSSLELLWKILTAFFSCVSIILMVNSGLIDIRFGLISLFCLSYILSSLLNPESNVIGAISLAFQIILAFNLGTLIAESEEEVLLMISKIITIYILADIIFGLLRMPESLGYKEDFTLFGFDNYAAYVILPLIVAKLGVDYKLHEKFILSDYICLIGSFLYKLYTFSVNAFFFFGLFIICLAMVKRSNLWVKIVNIRNVLIVLSITFLSVVYFHVEEYISQVLIYFGKSTNLSYRTYFWAESIKLLPKTPILGFGEYTEGFFQSAVGITRSSFLYYDSFTHSHNFFLDLYLRTGIVGFILYFLLLIATFWKFFGYEWVKDIDYSSKIFVIGVSIYFLMGFLDGYFAANTFYFLLGMYKLFKNTDQQDASCSFSI